MHSTIFTFITFLGLSAAAAVIPRQNELCGGLRTPLCCLTPVLGLIDLSCENAGDFTDLEAFEAECAMTGATAQCCTLPVGGEALVCNDA
ncbi:Hydrophobin [Pyrenophora teres f. maculata]|nr:Hydrophobin [Pyrenophora teres f. maculata]